MDAESGATEPQIDTPLVAERSPGSSGIPPRIPFPNLEFLRRSDDRAEDVRRRTRHFWTGLGIWGAGFVLAFALSWNTNTKWNRGVFAKLSYGVGAGLHSWSYLLLWLMYVWGRHDPAAFVAKVATVTTSIESSVLS